MANSKNPKRLKSDDDSENGYMTSEKGDTWQRFIILESTQTEMPLTKLSPFAIQKGIAGIAGTVKDVKKLRSGQILVECLKKTQAENLIRANMLANVPMKTLYHPSLNSSKGVIRTRELQDMDEAEIQMELMQQGVIHVKRITIRREEQIIKTGTYIMTFNKPHLPEKIHLGYQSVPVNTFIPNPLRCFNCQKFGHGSAGCKNKPLCTNCGEEGHGPSCNKTAKCSNCKADHPSSSKDCPLWIKEKEIQRVKCTEKVSYTEARRKIEESPVFKLKKSYATVVKPVLNSIECQTDLTWLNNDKPQCINKKQNLNKKKTQNASNQTQMDEDQCQIMEPNVSSRGRKTQTNTTAQSSKSNSSKKSQKPDTPKDVEMKEILTSRSRSLSPKCNNKGTVLVLPT